MMTKKQILIHVGYHKTATTWMQRRLFTPVHGYQQICGHREVDTHIVRPHGFYFDPVPMRWLIESVLSQVPEGNVPVISSETLCGNPFFGGRGSREYAERLRQIAPDANILVSIRAQLRVLPSIYMQYLFFGGTMTPAQFFAGTEELEFVRFDPVHYEYDRLIAHYRMLFGEDRVFVLPQESLLREPSEILAQLAQFCGNEEFELTEDALRKEGASYPEHAAPFLRRCNHFRRSALNPNPVVNVEFGDRIVYRSLGYATKLKPAMLLLDRWRPISQYVRQTFSGHFSASNQRLKEMVGTQADLSAYE